MVPLSLDELIWSAPEVGVGLALCRLSSRCQEEHLQVRWGGWHPVRLSYLSSLSIAHLLRKKSSQFFGNLLYLISPAPSFLENPSKFKMCPMFTPAKAFPTGVSRHMQWLDWKVLTFYFSNQAILLKFYSSIFPFFYSLDNLLKHLKTIFCLLFHVYKFLFTCYIDICSDFHNTE